MIRNWIIRQLTGKLVKAVSEDDILRVTNQGRFLRKHKLTPDELATLREEAKLLQESMLWQLMQREVEWLAFVQMRKALNEKDTTFSHAMFYNLDILNKFLKNI